MPHLVAVSSRAWPSPAANPYCSSPAALGTDGQWERAEKVVEWMMRSDIKPNVRTYTALITGGWGGQRGQRGHSEPAPCMWP